MLKLVHHLLLVNNTCSHHTITLQYVHVASHRTSSIKLHVLIIMIKIWKKSLRQARDCHNETCYDIDGRSYKSTFQNRSNILMLQCVYDKYSSFLKRDNAMLVTCYNHLHTHAHTTTKHFISWCIITMQLSFYYFEIVIVTINLNYEVFQQQYEKKLETYA